MHYKRRTKDHKFYSEDGTKIVCHVFFTIALKYPNNYSLLPPPPLLSTLKYYKGRGSIIFESIHSTVGEIKEIYTSHRH